MLTAAIVVELFVVVALVVLVRRMPDRSSRAYRWRHCRSLTPAERLEDYLVWRRGPLEDDVEAVKRFQHGLDVRAAVRNGTPIPPAPWLVVRPYVASPEERALVAFDRAVRAMVNSAFQVRVQ